MKADNEYDVVVKPKGGGTRSGIDPEESNDTSIHVGYFNAMQPEIISVDHSGENIILK